METILCAVDLGDSTRSVVAVAASLARALGTKVDLLHVIHLPPGLPVEYLTGNVPVDIRARAEDALNASAAELQRHDVEVKAHVALDRVDEGILKHARETNPSLLVVGTHARQGAARLLLGSVAERLVRMATCPVVVVPPSPGGRLAAAETLTKPLKIVAGIDLSPASDAALAWLRAIDGRSRCDLRLVHLYWPPREQERLGLGGPNPFEAEKEITRVLARDLHSHTAAHFGRDDVPLRVRPFGVTDDDPLAWEEETNGADLLVVGTNQGRHTTALAAIRGAHLPVVCVPSERPDAAPRHLRPVKTVLASTDFSPLGNAAVSEAYRMLLPDGGDVLLFHVAEPGPFELDPDRLSELEDRLVALTPHGMDVYGIRTRTAVVVDSSPGEAIVKAIRRFAPDLIVMSSHGRSGFRRAVRGSVAEHVMRAADKPVLVVPPSSDVLVESAEDRI